VVRSGASFKRLANVCSGSKATEMGSPRHVCFPSDSDRLRTSLEVRFVPKADMAEDLVN
jgi:hypothetical protein